MSQVSAFHGKLVRSKFMKEKKNIKRAPLKARRSVVCTNTTAALNPLPSLGIPDQVVAHKWCSLFPLSLAGSSSSLSNLPCLIARSTSIVWSGEILILARLLPNRILSKR
ncbi:hypothetical protein PoB_001110100 [Plakobranchus ocellatus]|uniref:Uncharacterized protein n=1 Tax=Plakobranchus ocellatus TaxID=259542 RepID=A0AAV3YQA5_9GAST|nr:hypothetical protein PoB_001110100 [Plakobranchus ocellatus]